MGTPTAGFGATGVTLTAGNDVPTGTPQKVNRIAFIPAFRFLVGSPGLLVSTIKPIFCILVTAYLPRVPLVIGLSVLTKPGSALYGGRVVTLLILWDAASDKGEE